MDVIEELGGPTVVARMTGVKVPSVIGWNGRIPEARCPAIERATDGRWPCEVLRPDVRWARVPDNSWPHPDGRPTIDVAAPPTPIEEPPVEAHPAGSCGHEHPGNSYAEIQEQTVQKLRREVRGKSRRDGSDNHRERNRG